jgi:adenylylsulfate kinase-like enzyme
MEKLMILQLDRIQGTLILGGSFASGKTTLVAEVIKKEAKKRNVRFVYLSGTSIFNGRIHNHFNVKRKESCYRHND